ncbi:MAG: DNA primase [Candidatus Bathyarchaeota archaeon]|nr:MAG: DNA primase [Candidatus Bathyarchaeota archaeon]
MGSSQIVTAKYVIRANFEIEGVVEKPDVIGAVFGQTEGLFGPELDLRELQKSGRIGRIEIKLQSKQDKTSGAITIPTSLDRVSTAILAASLESINRVGPCNSKVTLEKVEDIRDARRKTIIDRAKVILQQWNIETLPSTEEIFREVSETLRTAKIEKYGPEELSAGPDIEDSKEIIVVEGRADVLNLLRCGILNVIALEGAKIPETIIKLSKEKEVTAFLDGDRGGDLIQKELMQVTNTKYITRAPPRLEVEQLGCKEITKALSEKTPLDQAKPRRVRRKTLLPKKIVAVAKELEGSLEAVLLDKEMERKERMPVSDLAEKLPEIENVDTVVFDGVITQRLVDAASKNKIKYLVAARISDTVKPPLNVHLITFSDI